MFKKALIAGAAVAMLASAGASFGATYVRDGYRHPHRVVVVHKRPVYHHWNHHYHHAYNRGHHYGWDRNRQF